jgi:DNA-binding NarL/FixJ family response regulator
LYGNVPTGYWFVFKQGTAAGIKKMTQYSSPRRRALIVEDEIVIAMDLEQAMYELGFETSELAATPSRAFSLAMNSKPDIALVDVCLEGGREGIEAARWLREVCEVPVVFVTAYTDADTVERIHDQVPDAPVLPKVDWRKRLAHTVSEVSGQHTC